MRRRRRRSPRRAPWWLKAALLAALPLAALNLSVAWLGQTPLFPLSPYHLREKALALGRYLAHRPGCVLEGHPKLAAEVRRSSARHRLPKGLLAAVIEVESGGDPHRISPAGAMGPGQLMPDTARELGVEDPFDSRQAVEGSARYLAKQWRRYRNVRLAVAAYNAGPGAVAGRVPRNGETEYYVRKVMARYAEARRGRR